MIAQTGQEGTTQTTLRGFASIDVFDATAFKDLELAQFLVIYPGPHPYPLNENIRPSPWQI
jgi:hypothetical protein